MLMVDVGDQVCWRQILDVSDKFGYPCPLYLLIFGQIEVWLTFKYVQSDSFEANEMVFYS